MELEKQESIRILTIDSGLGGLGITADLVEKMRSGKYFRRTEIIFFNCRPSEEIGYDDLANNIKRSAVFSKALFSMKKDFSPDVILIACNTLSVLLKQTRFIKKTLLPVIGITGDGENMMLRFLKQHQSSSMIMFACPTTIDSETHKNFLIKAGIASERLIYQNCVGLAGLIENGENILVAEKIKAIIKESVSKTNNSSFAISLLCTHLGYISEVFRNSAKKDSSFNGMIVNPNISMVDNFLKKLTKCSTDSEVFVKVVTQTKHTEKMKRAIMPHIKKISKETAAAMIVWNAAVKTAYKEEKKINLG